MNDAKQEYIQHYTDYKNSSKSVKFHTQQNVLDAIQNNHRFVLENSSTPEKEAKERKTLITIFSILGVCVVIAIVMILIIKEFRFLWAAIILTIAGVIGLYALSFGLRFLGFWLKNKREMYHAIVVGPEGILFFKKEIYDFVPWEAIYQLRWTQKKIGKVTVKHLNIQNEKYRSLATISFDGYVCKEMGVPQEKYSEILAAQFQITVIFRVYFELYNA